MLASMEASLLVKPSVMQDNIQNAKPVAHETNVTCCFHSTIRQRIDLTHHLSTCAQCGGVRTHRHAHLSRELTPVADKGLDMQHHQHATDAQVPARADDNLSAMTESCPFFSGGETKKRSS